MKITKEMLENRAYTNLPTQFRPLGQECAMISRVAENGEVAQEAKAVQTGALVQENGDIIFRFIAPGAESVEVEFLADQITVELKDIGDGIWEAVFPFTFTGPKALQWKVNGIQILHAHTPIYYSYSKPVNFVDIPDLRMDYVLVKDVPHGTVSHEYFYSNATGNWETCVVYTPPGYEAEEKSYPILYLQHGAGECEISWIWNGKINFILDNLIAEGKCEPFVVVMNNGMIRTEIDDPKKYFSSNGFIKMLIEDCIPFIEKKYRIKGDKWNRAMAGLSMGSMQTSIAGMTHPELFGWLGLFSGFMRFLGSDMDFNTPLQAHLNAIKNVEQFKKDYKLFFRAIGEDDDFIKFFYEDDDFCKEIGASPKELAIHERKIYPGIHDWNVWRMSFCDFAQRIFKE